MSSQPATPDVDPIDEELVAYLDGELDVAGREQVERRLADDAAFRTRLRLLQRAWDALDVLGRTDADEKFTRTTVELVAVKAAEDVQHEQSQVVRRRSWNWIAWTAVAAASAAAGWLVLRLILTGPDQALLRDLAVIERVDEYRNAESFEFVQALDASGLFASEPGVDPATSVTTVGEETLEDRARHVANMKPEDKARLIQRNERFQALSPQERGQLWSLHQQIDSASGGKRLVTVLDRYNRWLKTLSPARQSELMSLPIDERLAKIEDIQQWQILSHFSELAGRLEKDDLNTIDAWMEEFVARHQEELLTRIDPDDAMRILSLPDAKARRGWLMWTVFAPRGPQRGSVLPPSADLDFAMLAARLSPTLQYELAVQKTDEDRKKLILTCARFALGSRFAPPPPKDEELSKFYAKLSPAERERVEKFEPQQMKRELTRLYQAKRFREGGWRPPGPPGDSKGSFGLPRGEGSRSRRDGEGRPPRGDQRDPKSEPAQKKDGPADAEPPEKS